MSNKLTLSKAWSFLMALPIGLLCIAPPINYDIPTIVNSEAWLYRIVAAGFFGVLICWTNIHWLLKALSVYLFFNCFISQIPYLSFEAYFLLVITMYFFWAYTKVDYEMIFNVIEAVFWLEIIILLVQQLDRDILMSMKPSEASRQLGIATQYVESKVFYGTVFQPMRLGSLFAIMAPFLIYRRPFYILPLAILAYCSGTLGFAFALVAGLLTLFFLVVKSWKVRLVAFVAGITFGLVCTVFTSSDAFRVAITEGRVPIGWLTLKSWVLDTTGPSGKPDFLGISQTGPVDWIRVFFGHGMDTYLPLFPIYKHDPNPFPVAHNDWLQIPWEIGAIGALLFDAYCLLLIWRLYRAQEYLLMSGCVIYSVNMALAFPQRMSQTVLLMTAYAAFCEKKIAERKRGTPRLDF